MIKILKSCIFGLALAIASLGSTAGSAATISFDGAGNQGDGSYTEDAALMFDDVRIVSGQCGLAQRCGALNKNEESVLTSVVSGAAFSLSSIFVKLQGNNSVLKLVTSLGNYLISANGTYNLASLGLFDDVTSVTFSFASQSNGNGGNVRFDDIGYSVPATVPVPAAGFLLLGAIGALGLAKRRKAA